MNHGKNTFREKTIILDYGCGTGTHSLRSAGRVNEIHGIDFAAGMIEVSQRKAAESGIGNVRFMQATIFDPLLEKGSYDAVLAWGYPAPG